METAPAKRARPSNDADFAIVKTRLLALSSQERAGFLEELFAEDPDVLAALRDRFAGLLADTLRKPLSRYSGNPQTPQRALCIARA